MPVQSEENIPLPPVIEMPSEYPEEDTSLFPCSICNRTFNPKSLERHEKVCQRTQSSKRQIFDAGKQRFIEVSDSPSRKKIENSSPKKKSRWREKHAEFLRTIRTVRTTSDDSDEGSPQRVIPSDYVKCPHCVRHFGPKAADRHINWCEEQKTRVPRSYTNQDEHAVQRLKTRTKYAPPKPGQNGWRAPKKKDVISSIPPPNVGPNMTPPGRLISPPPAGPGSHRQFSPPGPQYHRQISPPVPHNQRKFSPPAHPYGNVSPSRRSTLASLPPPSRYGSTGSLGRSSGRQFSSMLQSVTGCPGGYGVSSGYGSSYLYGKPAQNNSSFNRSASLRLPRKRPDAAKRMARRRDLASDMLSSVAPESSKREEPEGGEDRMEYRRPYEQYNNSYKMKEYDPYSAAELQLQDLLGPSKDRRSSSGGLRGSDLVGSTGSLKGLGLTRDALERRTYDDPPIRRHGLGTMSLCSFRMDHHDDDDDLKFSPVPVRRIDADDDSSEIESLGGYSIGMQTPIDEFEDLLASLTTAITDEEQPKNDYGRSLENNYGIPKNDYGIPKNNYGIPKNDYGIPKNDYGTSNRIRPDGGGSYTQSPYSPLRRSPSKERSPPYQTSQSLVSGYKHNELDENYPRVSSNSSTDSRQLSSPLYSSTLLDPLKQDVTTTSTAPSNSCSSSSQMPKFCYECGNKFPVHMAKFCCQCGAPRVSAV